MIPLRDNIPSKSSSFVTWLLIVMNFYVFYLQYTSNIGFDRFITHWAVIPVKLFSQPGTHWKTLVTATFLHGGWMHIIGNMVFLYIFGNNVEDRMGHFKFISFYLLIGILANVSQAFISRSSSIPLIGASGAIAGVLGAYFFYYPHARILTLVPLGFFTRIVEIPAFLFLGFWFLMQAFSTTVTVSMQMVNKQASGGVAFLAHAVGFVAGIIFSPLFGDKREKYK